jgi:hypothetical protein
MLLHQNRFVDDVYERLREMQRGVEDVEVLLFVSMDCDALCACQILTVSVLSCPPIDTAPQIAAPTSACCREPRTMLRRCSRRTTCALLSTPSRGTGIFKSASASCSPAGMR